MRHFNPSCSFHTIIQARPYLIPALAAIFFLAVLQVLSPAVLPAALTSADLRAAAERAFPAKSDAQYEGKAQFSIRFSSWQNPWLTLYAPRGCLHAVTALRPGSEAQVLHESERCATALRLRLPGADADGRLLSLDVALEHIRNGETPVYVAPALLEHMPTALACLGFAGALAALGWRVARGCGLECAMAALLVAASCYYGSWLALRSHFAYTNDVYNHLAAMNHMSWHWEHLKGNMGVSFHPDGYYMLSGLVNLLAMQGAALHPVLVLRLLSLALFFGYALCALLMLQDLLPRGRATLLAAACFLLWPSHILLATRINNDLPVYFAWGVALLGLSRWQRGRGPRWLATALMAGGAGMLCKSNAALPLLIAAGFMLYGPMGGRLLRILRSNALLVGVAALTLGAAATLRINHIFVRDFLRMLGTQGMLWHDAAFPFMHPERLDYYLTFHLRDFFEMPFALTYHSSDYWSFLLKTSLYSERKWHFYTLARIMNALLLALLASYALAVARLGWRMRRQVRRWLPYAAAVLMPVAGSLLYAHMYPMFFVTQDFRYIVPVLPPLALGFALACQHASSAFDRAACAVMQASAVLLAACGVALYWGQAFVPGFL